MYLQNKPQFLLPELIGGSIFIFALIIIAFSLPALVISYVEASGILATFRGEYFLRSIFFTWIIVCVVTGWLDL